MKSHAELTMEDIEKDYPLLHGDWRPNIGNLPFKGKGSVETALVPIIEESAARMHYRIRALGLTPNKIAVKALSTSSFNATSVFCESDGSYAIGIDQALLIWHSGILVSLLEAEAKKLKDADLVEDLVFFSDLFVAQRFPKEVYQSWSFPFKMMFKVHKMGRAKDRWESTTVPLGLAYCDFIFAHELGHIELKHIAEGGAACQFFGSPTFHQAHFTNFFGNHREHEADRWALDCCRRTEPHRDFDKFDNGYVQFWGLRERAIRDIRVAVLETSLRVTFLIWNLLEDLFPQRVTATHPPSVSRLEHLNIDTPKFGFTELPEGFRLLPAIEQRLVKLKKSDVWLKAISRSTK